MVNKLFVFHGDLGAGKNILKNLILLNKQVHFPVGIGDRAQYLIKNIYRPESKLNWFKYEYILKDYKEYDIDMPAGDANVDDLLHLSTKLKTLLETNHYALDLFNKERVHEIVDLDYVKFLMVYPVSDAGLRWQVRAYAEKKKPAEMHNFTYIDQNLINEHKVKYGLESWIKVNLYNFYQNAQEYVLQLKDRPWNFVSLEHLLDSDRWPDLVTKLENTFSVEINRNDAYRVLQAWADLHWPTAATDEWEHVDIFDGLRSKFSDLAIRTHSCSQ